MYVYHSVGWWTWLSLTRCVCACVLCWDIMDWTHYSYSLSAVSPRCWQSECSLCASITVWLYTVSKSLSALHVLSFWLKTLMMWSVQCWSFALLNRGHIQYTYTLVGAFLYMCVNWEMTALCELVCVFTVHCLQAAQERCCGVFLILIIIIIISIISGS